MRWLSALCPVCQHHACTGHETLPALATVPNCEYCRVYPGNCHAHPTKPPPVLCAAGNCTRPAVVTVRLIPRPHTPFSAAAWVPSCPSCLDAIKARGAVLDMVAIGDAERE